MGGPVCRGPLVAMPPCVLQLQGCCVAHTGPPVGHAPSRMGRRESAEGDGASRLVRGVFQQVPSSRQHWDTPWGKLYGLPRGHVGKTAQALDRAVPRAGRCLHVAPRPLKRDQSELTSAISIKYTPDFGRECKIAR